VSQPAPAAGPSQPAHPLDAARAGHAGAWRSESQAIDTRYCKRVLAVLAVLATAGLYEHSGQWLYQAAPVLAGFW
jgi:hypothetical protein